MAGTIEVNDRSVEWRPGMTVADVLEACDYRFPLVVVNIDGRLIKRAHYGRTEVPEGAVVKVIHMMSGG